jgi:hypothetical protein
MSGRGSVYCRKHAKGPFRNKSKDSKNHMTFQLRSPGPSLWAAQRLEHVVSASPRHADPMAGHTQWLVLEDEDLNKIFQNLLHLGWNLLTLPKSTRLGVLNIGSQATAHSAALNHVWEMKTCTEHVWDSFSWKNIWTGQLEIKSSIARHQSILRKQRCAPSLRLLA